MLPHVPIIVVSGALEVSEQMNALQGPRRAHYCLSKPVDLEVLRQTIQTALQECGEQEVIQQFESLEKTRRSDIEDLLSRSTDRLSRQHQIRLQLSDSNEKLNISALARDHRVARRTIIRDLQEMIRRGELDTSVYPDWEKRFRVIDIASPIRARSAVDVYSTVSESDSFRWFALAGGSDCRFETGVSFENCRAFRS